ASSVAAWWARLVSSSWTRCAQRPVVWPLIPSAGGALMSSVSETAWKTVASRWYPPGAVAPTRSTRLIFPGARTCTGSAASSRISLSTIAPPVRAVTRGGSCRRRARTRGGFSRACARTRGELRRRPLLPGCHGRHEILHCEPFAASGRVDPGAAEDLLGLGRAARPVRQGRPEGLAPLGEGGVDAGEDRLAIHAAGPAGGTEPAGDTGRAGGALQPHQGRVYVGHRPEDAARDVAGAPGPAVPGCLDRGHPVSA